MFKYQILTNIIHLLQLLRKLVMYVLFELDIKMKGIKGKKINAKKNNYIFYNPFISQIFL
jgi:hypothetical protein